MSGDQDRGGAKGFGIDETSLGATHETRYGPCPASRSQQSDHFNTKPLDASFEGSQEFPFSGRWIGVP
jgi:hypothetical protein